MTAVPNDEDLLDDDLPSWHYKGYHLDGGNFTTAMVHLYRAEVTRANLWRNRLDTTTNWAVVTVGAALTFTFSSPDNPHFVLLLVLMAVLIFLYIEARRYAYYALWYHRVRLMESGFFATMIAPPYHPPSDWGDQLAQTLREPTFQIPRWQAIGIRYRRNYIWLNTLLCTSWLIKLALHPAQAGNLAEMAARACVGGLGGALIVAAVGTVYLGLLALALVASFARRNSQGHANGKRKVKRGPLYRPQQPKDDLALIITKAGGTVAKHLMHDLGRGVTALPATGMYTGERRDVLLCALTDVQVEHLEGLVHQADAEAFVIVLQASQVRGRGFSPFEAPH